jgi:hypothetical protein
MYRRQLEIITLRQQPTFALWSFALECGYLCCVKYTIAYLIWDCQYDDL